MRIEGRHKHERVVEVLADPLFVGLNSLGAAIVKRTSALRQQLNRLQNIVENNRFIDVELEVALGAGEGDRVIVAEYFYRDHGQRLALGRIDLPGHNR